MAEVLILVQEVLVESRMSQNKRSTKSQFIPERRSDSITSTLIVISALAVSKMKQALISKNTLKDLINLEKKASAHIRVEANTNELAITL